MLYTIIYDFMWKDLRLRGAEKEVFAVIYGFWKKGKLSWLERRTHKPKVTGSIPVGATIFCKYLAAASFFDIF